MIDVNSFFVILSCTGSLCLLRTWWFYVLHRKNPTGTQRPVDVPESFPEGPKFRDLQGTFRGFSGDRWKKL